MVGTLLIFFVVFFAFAQNALSQSLEVLVNDDSYKEVFIKLDSYKKSSPSAVPELAINLMQAYIAQFDSIVSIHSIGTADQQTRVYSNLANGTLARSFESTQVNNIAALQRAMEMQLGVGGTIGTAIVEKAADRGVVVQITLPKLIPVIIGIRALRNYINVSPGRTFSLRDYVVEWSDGSTTHSGASFSISADSSTDYLLDDKGFGQVADTGSVVAKIKQGEFIDSVTVNVLPFPETEFPECKNPVVKQVDVLAFINSNARVGGGLLMQFNSDYLVSATVAEKRWRNEAERSINISLGYSFHETERLRLAFLVGPSWKSELEDNVYDAVGLTGLFHADYRLYKNVSIFGQLGMESLFKHQHGKVGSSYLYQDFDNPNIIGVKNDLIRQDKKTWETNFLGIIGINVNL